MRMRTNGVLDVPKDADSLDPQRERLYQWEADWDDWNRSTVSLAKCRAAIRKACKWYKVSHPTVKQHDGQISFSIPCKDYISMQRADQKNIPVALHEAAHHIAYKLHGNRIADHGPTFLGVYIDLLVRAKVAPPIAIKATAKAHKLKWKS